MPFPMPPMPPMGAGPGMGMPPPGAGAPQAAGANPLPDLAMSSLDQLQGDNKPNEVFSRVDEALGLAHKLLLSVIPQVTNINPSVAKDLHQISQRLLEVKLNVHEEMPVGDVPPELMALLDSGDDQSGGGLPPRPTSGPSPLGM